MAKSKDYINIAKEILKLVGGEENITHLEHCSTRLRFSIVDIEKVDKNRLKAISGVMGVIASGHQCQVVIGNDVIEVYDELLKLSKFTGGNGAVVSGGKKDIKAMALDFMVGVFQPLVPAIAGAGILKAFLSLLTLMNIISPTNAWYTILFNAADAALYFLPVMVAVNMATKLNCNRLVAIASTGAMILPAMTTAIGEGLTIFGFTIQNITYTYQVFPAILTVAFLYFVEKGVTKISPKPIRVFFVPMICFAIVVPTSLLLLGPLGYNVGQLLTTAILFLYDKLGWLAVGLLAAILPFMISMGMHKAFLPYAITSITEMGSEMLYLPASLAHNISESGACFAVALKTKDEELRSAAMSAGISALFGITEPALYGITIQHKRALYGVIIGSFVGGLTVGLASLKAFVAMGPGLAGMAMFVDINNGKNIVWGFVGFGISLVISFIATFIIFKDEVAEVEKVQELNNLESIEEECIISPLEGKLVDLSEVKDEVFSAGILGDGIAIIPEKGELHAPVDAVIDMISDSKHAISMIGNNGIEMLLHVGMDTVKLEGKHFEPQVKNGDTVKAGQLLMKFDIESIKKAGYEVTTPVVIMNSDHYVLTKAKQGSVKTGHSIIRLSKKLVKNQ